MELKEIAENYSSFMEIWDKDKTGRYHSYDDCRKIFLDNINEETRNVDKVALYLFYYLASWGMLRGSGWLMQKDYHIFIPIVQLLYKNDSLKLLNYDPSDGILTCNEYVKKISELGKQIEENIVTIKYYKFNKITKKDEEHTVCSKTDRVTLITKILMGTLGCAPAIDNCNKETLKKMFDKKTIRFTNSLFESLWNLANENIYILKEIKEKIASVYKIDYSVFKVLDMILWETGKRLGAEE